MLSLYIYTFGCVGLASAWRLFVLALEVVCYNKIETRYMNDMFYIYIFIEIHI